MLRGHLEGILSWTKSRVSNGAVEGMNNKIKSISHRSFGFRTARTSLRRSITAAHGYRCPPNANCTFGRGTVKEGRVTFQRILTYTLNSVTKKSCKALFLAVGLVMTRQAILTPMLMVIIMLTEQYVV